MATVHNNRPKPSEHYTDYTPRQIEQLRQALRQSVSERGLRRTAAELPMSPAGLSHFVRGAAPYTKTIRRAAAWLARRSAQVGEPDAATGMALAVVADTFPPERREAALADLHTYVAELRRG